MYTAGELEIDGKSRRLVVPENAVDHWNKCIELRLRRCFLRT
jgi:hypothetical protein